ncbi:MAG: group 1 glycosyl transferase [archaeon GW2011_AR10]|uniref:Glycosyltransferase family 4 protein n=1 Tax=Candidatus Iainarchaeum sp. TaxID=3101447 RepID=A0A7J4IRB9_9ARCH|nr:MAG: group 1 glycosyl transferase [archaeon GW2011_AR10]HIH08038.1 glycosyltransferase family 4 protein [Candidatus Diapherotrites archaeon]
MKVAEASANFPPYFGGIGNTCFHNAAELANLGHEVTVFSSKTGNEEYHYPENMSVRLSRPLFRYGNAVFLPELLNIKGFDAVHVHMPFHFGAEMLFFSSKANRIPLIATYQMDLVGEGWLKHFFRLHRETVVKPLLRRASRVIVSSMDYAENSDISGILKKREGSLFELPNGVDVGKFNPKVKALKLRRKLGLEKDKVVLFVGALDKSHYFKGVENLVKAFAAVKKHEAKLVIVGEGNLKQYYMEKAAKHGVGSRTIFAGRVEDEELPQYYALSDFLVLPSTDKAEAFGLVAVEAMASGKAVIASNLPGVRKNVEEGKTGLLVEPNNVKGLSGAINYLVENESTAKRMGINGRRKAEEAFDWKKIGAKLEKIISGVLGE